MPCWDATQREFLTSAWKLAMLLQQGVIEADIAINTFAAPEDRERIRIAVTETGVIDWRDK